MFREGLFLADSSEQLWYEMPSLGGLRESAGLVRRLRNWPEQCFIGRAPRSDAAEQTGRPSTLRTAPIMAWRH